ncbi:DUF4922 domain-containing protein [Balneolales bacterium ANBcel1]|nr:DUF4922 domain-containing protein [Balneolales bacterium ANBcel1]
MIRFSDFFPGDGKHKALDRVRERTLTIHGIPWRVQYNPARYTSSMARVDMRSISERSCFLCPENRPADQKSILHGEYELLANPRPVFHRHLTIPHRRHQPQLIRDTFGDMLDLAKALGSAGILLYNGPQCGASAPDHLHFQAGERGFLPIDRNWRELADQFGTRIVAAERRHSGSPENGDTPAGPDERVELTKIDDGLRRFVMLSSPNRDALNVRFLDIYEAYHSLVLQKKAAAGKSGHSGSNHGWAVYDEPKMNILVTFDPPGWRVFIFLRSRHRPNCYYLEDERRMIFSPAAVEYGGVCIFPNAGDYERVSVEQLSSMFREVSIDPADFEQIIRHLR